jgi:S-adenosylmethionine-diacylglycerol 3-amino-3-carboxypropyl transferase
MSNPLRKERVTLPGAVENKLFFAQVREDPLVDIGGLNPKQGDRIAIVSSGGCTALSMLAAGASHVVALDLNRSQNHLVDLKASALSKLDYPSALELMGAVPSTREARLQHYEAVRALLTDDSRKYWDQRRKDVSGGLIQSGVSEKFGRILSTVISLLVHSPKRQQQLLEQKSLADQQSFYAESWNTWRWRALFQVLMNRWMFSRTYHPAFFEHVENPSFSKHFLGLVEHALTQVPVGSNYFLFQTLKGHYPVSAGDSALPPYLSSKGAKEIAGGGKSLLLVDGTFQDGLRTMPDGSINGFALSNILEWMTPPMMEDLFSQILRTAAPGATLVFRNFVGWTDLPEKWKSHFFEDVEKGTRLIRQDRSMLQRRIAICKIRK